MSNDNKTTDESIDTKSSRYGTDRTTDELISRMSDLRCQYNCFDESERDAYGVLSEAIKVLSAQPDLDEWCTDCSEYDHVRHCCPRFNRVIREAVEEVRQPEIIHCRDCKHYYFADNRIPQEQRYTCELDGDRWTPDSYCSFAERREE